MTPTTAYELTFLAIQTILLVPDWPRKARMAGAILAAVAWGAVFSGVWKP